MELGPAIVQQVNGHAHPDFTAEGSRDAQARLAGPSSSIDQTYERGSAMEMEPLQPSWSLNGFALAVHASLTPPEPSASRINPFHLLSHPNSHSLLPPLPGDLMGTASTSRDPDRTMDDSLRRPALNVDDQAPIHISRVDGNSVQITAGGPPAQRFIQKVGGVFRKSEPALSGEVMRASPVVMQGPPPSPPISLVDSEEDEQASAGIPMGGNDESPILIPLSSTPNHHIFTSDLTAEPADMISSPLKPDETPGRLTVPQPRRVSSSSTTSRTGSLAIVRSGRLAQRVPSPVDPGFHEAFPLARRQDSGGTSSSLPDTVPLTHRLTRRSTNSSPVAAPAVQRSPLTHTQSTFLPSPRQQTTVPGVEGAVLDSDILEQAANIRRQRLERRQKKANVSDEESKPEHRIPRDKEEAKVLVGNLIGEDHVNYILMYNMLTGIRIGVSRCQAKIKRPVTEEDYIARHKFSFDVVGNELTPSARYDFKFKDYAPWVFRDLRDEYFHLDPADYLLSLTAKYILSELGSPGKSGSFFYFSSDYRFIIKTISHAEHKFLRSILKDYHQHVRTNPHTLLSRFYGLHRVKLPRGRKIHFVIMNNLFPPHRDIHESYDLKGSAWGREYPEEKAKLKPRAVLKDLNWVNRGRTLELGPEKRALFSEQLRRDMEFLRQKDVMDYSLLVGIHNMERGNRDNLRENQLSVFHPEVRPPRRKPSAAKGPSEASNVRKAIRRSDPKMLDVASQLPSADSSDRRHFLFYQDEGGLRATDEANQNMDVIYYLGIIDICTPYNTKKKAEHLWKSLTEDRATISCVDPARYGQRFLNFLLSVMRGGDLALRPEGLIPEAKDNKATVRPVGLEVADGRVAEPEVLEEVAESDRIDTTTL